MESRVDNGDREISDAMLNLQAAVSSDGAFFGLFELFYSEDIAAAVEKYNELFSSLSDPADLELVKNAAYYAGCTAEQFADVNCNNFSAVMGFDTDPELKTSAYRRALFACRVAYPDSIIDDIPTTRYPHARVKALRTI